MTSYMSVLFYAHVHAKRVKKPLAQCYVSSCSTKLHPPSRHRQILIRCRVRHPAECTLQVRMMKGSGFIRRDLSWIFVALALRLHICRKEYRHISNEEIVNSNKTFPFLATVYFQITYSVLVESNIRYIAFGNIALTCVLGKQSSKTPSTKGNTGSGIIANIPIEVLAPFKIRVYYKFRKSYCGVKITSYDRTLTTMGFSVSARLIHIESGPSLPFHCIVLNESGTTSTARQWWVSW